MSNGTGPDSGVKVPVMADVQRTPYDLSHWSMKVGAIGSPQAISCVPVVAGDSFELDASCVFRLSPLRRNLYLDVVVDLFAFYVPHRHIYGSNWVDFIKAGFDEGVTLGTDALATDAELHCAGFPCTANLALPRWLTRGPIQIWNNYFRDPSDVAGILADNYFTGLASTDPILDYGIPACHIKRIWNSAVPVTTTAADYRLPLDTGEVNLYQLAALKGRLATETARDFYSLRYRDVLQHTFDSHVNIDADQRPELIMRSRQWLSGYDVDGTDDATLGTYSGKAQGVCKISFPRKFFPEHGTLWVYALLRFPPVYSYETNYLVTHPEPTYTEISGDPNVIRREKPVVINASDVFHGNAAVALGSTPHSQWYREQPHLMHRAYVSSAGHPFIDPGPIANRNQAVYIQSDLYEEVFSSVQLKHWNAQCFIDLQANRFIPDPQVSIFAGTQ